MRGKRAEIKPLASRIRRKEDGSNEGERVEMDQVFFRIS